MNNQDKQKDLLPLTAMLLSFCGFTSWVIGDVIIKILRDYDFYVISFLASAASLTLLILFSKQLGGFKDTIYKPKIKLRIFRGVITSICSLLAVIIFSNLELATAYAIIFSIPLISKIMSVFINGETIRLSSWVISIVGFLGVLIVVRPGMVPLNVGTLAALIFIFLFSFAYVIGRKIGAENQTLLSLSIFGTIFTFSFTSYFAIPIIVEMPIKDVMIGLSIGVFAVTGALLVGSAYNRAPTAYVAPVHYTQILWGAAIGALFFGEIPDLYTITGAFIIIGSGLLLILKAKKS